MESLSAIDTLRIVQLDPADDTGWSVFGELVAEYALSLDVDLCFQGYAAESADFAHAYGGDGGAFVAYIDEHPAGCIGLRPGHNNSAEMKRLFVRDAARGMGAGRKLAERVIELARSRGAARIILDTLPSMASAQTLYHQLGFVPCAPYYETPAQGTVFMALELS
jgi:GNAT superfamily N-acetyltransferase